MNDLPKKRRTGCQPVLLPPLNDELSDLLESLCLEELFSDGVARLEELVSSDPECCRQYIVFMQMHALAERFAGKWRADSSDESTLTPQPIPALSTASDQLPATHYPLTASFIGGWAFSYVVASVVLCLMLLGGWAYTITHDDQSVDNRPKKTVSGPDVQFVSVGRVTGTKDCVWAKDSMGTIVGASVPLGREYALISGLMEIAYTSGAQVILEGPCTYKVDSKIGGYLELGKLTARVGNAKPQAASSQSLIPNPQSLATNPQSPVPDPQPLFAVRTPTAVVTDLGTEFGVEVTDNGDTTSYVFQGSVRVEAISDAGSNSGDRDMVLRKSESVRVEKVGRVRETHHAFGEKTELVRFTHPTDLPEFVRRLHEPPKQLDLLDIVAGGDGLGSHRERGIDPLTGKEDPIYVGDRHFGDNIYKPVAWHKYIDGVFIADGHAGPVQIDSAGHVFALPETFGRTIGSIWSRAAEISEGRLRLGKEKTGLYIYSMGQAEHFMPKGRGALCSVANAGITFDLQMMRKNNPSAYPSRFSASLGIVDASYHTTAPTSMADVWIIVDGKLRFSRLKLRPNEELLEIDVELKPTDRFLTYVTTDGGNTTAFDWMVLGDPVLFLTPTGKSKSDAINMP